jgi:hypothetical protein
MEDISYFYKFLDNSDISLLGYRFKYERIKDEIISKISYYEIKKIDSSFSFKQLIRNQKLDELLNDNPSKEVSHLIIDLGNLHFIGNGLSRKQHIDNAIEILRKEMYSQNPQNIFKPDDFPNYRLLILSPLNSFESKETMFNFVGGNRPIYVSDFATVIHEDSLEVIKNRFEHNNNKISLENLKNYYYIRNYETNK